MSSTPAAKPKSMKGLKDMLVQFKTLATYNRVNGFYVIGEFSKNKYNPMSNDFHIRGIYNLDTHEKLSYPRTLSRICFNMSQEIQPDWKLYIFKSSPLTFKFDEETSKIITRNEYEGKYGKYFAYEWPSNEETEIEGDIAL